MRINARTKIVELDGARFEIGSLSLLQSALIPYLPPWMVPYVLVAVGLNNAAPDSEVDWTVARLRRELDLVSFRVLLDAIVEFSGLRRATETVRIKSDADAGEIRGGHVEPTKQFAGVKTR